VPDDQHHEAGEHKQCCEELELGLVENVGADYAYLCCRPTSA
jgi:hypothetical protein